jgi:predicted nucleic acid-binding protein
VKKRGSVYLESSVISYYANSISSDLKVAAEQKITQDWWAAVLPQFDAFISDYVLQEVELGRRTEAAARLKIAQSLTVLPENKDVYGLASEYVKRLALPKNGEMDAFHLATAAVHQIDFLLSWNCKHIANAFKYRKIREINQKLGFFVPVICTPRELMEV